MSKLFITIDSSEIQEPATQPHLTEDELIEKLENLNEPIEDNSSHSKKRNKSKRNKKRVEDELMGVNPLGETIFVWVGTVILITVIVFYGWIGLQLYKYYILGEELKPIFSMDIKPIEELPSSEEKESTQDLLDEILNELHKENEGIQADENTTKQKFILINYDGLNVRSEASKQSSVLGQLNLYEEVELIEDLEESEWFKVRFEGQEAYIHKDYSELIEE